MRRQLALLLSRAQIPLEWLQPSASEDADAETELPEDIVECLSNTHLSRFFREFGKEVGVAEPKSLEDVYKSHLENTRKQPFLKLKLTRTQLFYSQGEVCLRTSTLPEET